MPPPLPDLSRLSREDLESLTRGLYAANERSTSACNAIVDRVAAMEQRAEATSARLERIEIVSAPGDRCGGSKLLANEGGRRCPGCRACS